MKHHDWREIELSRNFSHTQAQGHTSTNVVTEFAPDGVTLTRQTPLSSRAYTFKISLYPPLENQFRKMSTTNNNVVMAHFSFS